MQQSDEFTYKEFEFDSLDCINSATSGTPANTPQFLLGKPLDNIAYIKVLEAQIPFSYYLVNDLNNAMYLTEYYDLGGVSTARGLDSVLLPNGNYTASTMCSALETALNASSVIIAAAAPLTGPSRVYVATFSAITGKISITTPATITINSDFSIVPNVGVTEDSWTTSFAAYLGFYAGPGYTNSEQVVFSTATVPYSLTPPNAVNLTGPFYVYLCSNKLGGLVDLFLPANGVLNRTGGGADGPQMAKIPMMSEAFSVSNWIDPCPEKWFPAYDCTLAGQVDFFCTLGLNNTTYPIDFNGLGFSFKLGMLIRNKDYKTTPGGGVGNDRVITRTFS